MLFHIGLSHLIQNHSQTINLFFIIQSLFVHPYIYIHIYFWVYVVVFPGHKDRGGHSEGTLACLGSWQDGGHTFFSWSTNITNFVSIVLYQKQRHLCLLFIQLLNWLFFTRLVTVAMLGTDQKKNPQYCYCNNKSKCQNPIFTLAWYFIAFPPPWWISQHRSQRNIFLRLLFSSQNPRFSKYAEIKHTFLFWKDISF